MIYSGEAYLSRAGFTLVYAFQFRLVEGSLASPPRNILRPTVSRV